MQIQFALQTARAQSQNATTTALVRAMQATNLALQVRWTQAAINATPTATLTPTATIDFTATLQAAFVRSTLMAFNATLTRIAMTNTPAPTYTPTPTATLTTTPIPAWEGAGKSGVAEDLALLIMKIGVGAMTVGIVWAMARRALTLWEKEPASELEPAPAIETIAHRDIAQSWQTEWRAYYEMFLNAGRRLGTFKRDAMVTAAPMSFDWDRAPRRALTAQDWNEVIAVLTTCNPPVFYSKPGKVGTGEVMPSRSLSIIRDGALPFPKTRRPVQMVRRDAMNWKN